MTSTSGKGRAQSSNGRTIFLAILVVILTASITYLVTIKIAGNQSTQILKSLQSEPLIADINRSAEDAYSSVDDVPGLRAALSEFNDDTSPCSDLMGRYKVTLFGVTADKSQALVGFGCGGYGSVRSFMVKQDDSWLQVGAADHLTLRNHDESANLSQLLELPSCQLVENYGIQKSIAPVCYQEKVNGKSSLLIGDKAEYSYKVR